VADLRRRLVLDDEAGAAAAATALGRLAAVHVAGADPGQWWIQRVLSDDRPLRRPEQQVRLSPSKVESFGDCRLRWALTSAGGDAPSQGSANLGTLIHDIAHELGDDADAETLVAEVERRWGRLGLPPGWATDRQREQAHQMAYRLAAYFADPTRPEKVDSEVPLRIDVGRATISGRVDRLEREPDGGLRVVDYKTGSSKPRAQDVATHPQLGTYQLAVEHGAFAPRARPRPAPRCCISARPPAPRASRRSSNNRRWTHRTTPRGRPRWWPRRPTAWAAASSRRRPVRGAPSAR
jgi:RecB family exonuclease